MLTCVIAKNSVEMSFFGKCHSITATASNLRSIYVEKNNLTGEFLLFWGVGQTQKIIMDIRVFCSVCLRPLFYRCVVTVVQRNGTPQQRPLRWYR